MFRGHQILLYISYLNLRKLTSAPLPLPPPQKPNKQTKKLSFLQISGKNEDQFAEICLIMLFHRLLSSHARSKIN